MSNVNVVRTGIAGLIQTCQYLGKPVPSVDNTTLNEKLNIQKTLTLTDQEVPRVRYLAIGNGGHGFITGSNGRTKWKALHHTARHGALYNQVPFALRRVDNDFTPAERARYRLRQVKVYNGVSYAAYYLRVLDLSSVEPGMELRTVRDGTTTSVPYAPTLADLNPVPPRLVIGEAVTTTGEYIASTAKVPFNFDAADVQEFINAMRIIEGDDEGAIISEVATVAAVDRAVTGDFNGTQAGYTEAASAIITSFIATAFLAPYNLDGFQMLIDVGNVEPLLNVQP